MWATGQAEKIGKEGSDSPGEPVKNGDRGVLLRSAHQEPGSVTAVFAHGTKARFGAD
jgi:hypothetical protein